MSIAAEVTARMQGRSLRTVLSTTHLLALRRSHELAQDAVGGRATFDPDDPEVRRMLDEAGERITGIVEETRRRVRAYIEEGISEEMSFQEIAALIRADKKGGFKPWRAKTIARTETGMILNGGSLNGYERSGMVDEVEVLDGDDCDWPDGHGHGGANGRIVSIAEAKRHLLAHPNCFPSGTVVLAPNASAAFTRWFEGELVVLRTAADDLLSCTPNHPILTSRGWVAAGTIRKGDDVFRCPDPERVAALLDPDHDQVPALIEDVAGALVESGECSSSTVPATPIAFHGDGSGGDVHVVWTDGLGEGEVGSKFFEQSSKVPVVFADVGTGQLLPLGPTAKVVEGSLVPSHRGVSGGSELGSPLAAELGHSERVGFRLVSEIVSARSQRSAEGGAPHSDFARQHIARFAGQVPGMKCVEVELETLATRWSHFDAFALEDAAHSGSSDTELLRKAGGSLAGLVAPTQIVHVDRREFSGHVHNLETRQGWYLANGIIAHNCQRAFAPRIRPESRSASAPQGAGGGGQPGAVARGTPVSDAFSSMPGPQSKVGQAAREALEAVAEVHGDGNLPNIPLRASAGTRTAGSFKIRQAPGGPRQSYSISVSAKGSHPVLTATHEIGHFLDFEQIGIMSGARADVPGEVREAAVAWLNAIGNSRAVSDLNDMRRAGAVIVNRGTVKQVVAVGDEYFGYLLSHEELWARSYSQYIATRSTNAALKGELADVLKASREAEIRLPDQWQPDDFEPIAEAIDKLMEALGWRGPRG